MKNKIEKARIIKTNNKITTTLGNSKVVVTNRFITIKL